MTEKKVAGKKSAELKRNFDKGRRVMSILYLVLVAIVILVLVRQFFTEHYEHCFTCLLTLVLFLIPTFVERKLKITLPNTLEVIIILFIFAAEILGEIRAFYLLVPWWDTMLHTMNGFLMAAIGVSMVDILNQNDVFKFQLSPFFVALVAFCFSMTIGILWEFFEFAMDFFVHTDMQKDAVLNLISSVDLNTAKENMPVIVKGIEEVTLTGGNLTVNGVPAEAYVMGIGGYLDLGIKDTMMDLFVNFIGAVIFSGIGFFYVKNRGKSNWAKRFIPFKKREDAPQG